MGLVVVRVTTTDVHLSLSPVFVLDAARVNIPNVPFDVGAWSVRGHYHDVCGLSRKSRASAYMHYPYVLILRNMHDKTLEREFIFHEKMMPDRQMDVKREDRSLFPALKRRQPCFNSD